MSLPAEDVVVAPADVGPLALSLLATASEAFAPGLNTLVAGPPVVIPGRRDVGGQPDPAVVRVSKVDACHPLPAITGGPVEPSCGVWVRVDASSRCVCEALIATAASVSTVARLLVQSESPPRVDIDPEPFLEGEAESSAGSEPRSRTRGRRCAAPRGARGRAPAPAAPRPCHPAPAAGGGRRSRRTSSPGAPRRRPSGHPLVPAPTVGPTRGAAPPASHQRPTAPIHAVTVPPWQSERRPAADSRRRIRVRRRTQMAR